MEYTANISLKKPSQTDFYNVEDFNFNMNKIDDELTKKDTAIANTNTEVSKKANKTDVTAHTGNVNVHVTTQEKNNWNRINGIDTIINGRLENISAIQDDCIHDLAALTFELKQKKYIDGGGIDNIIVDTIEQVNDVDLQSGNFDTSKKQLYI